MGSSWKSCACRGKGLTQAAAKSTWNSLSDELTDKHITDFKHYIPFPAPCWGPGWPCPGLSAAQDPTSGPGAVSPCPSITRSPWPCPPRPTRGAMSSPVPIPGPIRGPMSSPVPIPREVWDAQHWGRHLVGVVGWGGLPGSAWGVPSGLLMRREPQPLPHPRYLRFHVTSK